MRSEFNLEGVKVGDEITIVENRRVTNEVVTRVGRVNLAVDQYGGEQRFDIKTGAEKRSINAGGTGASAFKPGEYELYLELVELQAEVRRDMHKLNRLSLEQLKALRRWLNPEE